MSKNHTERGWGGTNTKADNNQGSWVIEYNSKNPKLQTVKFYNDSSRLIHEEIVFNRLNIKDKETQAALNNICARLCEKDRLQNLNAAIKTEQPEKQ